MNASAELPFQPQSDNGGAISGFVLAALVHAALFTFLYFGVNWTVKTPEPAEAIVWDALPAMSAPAPAPPPPPAPEPVPKVETPPEPPKPMVEEPPAPLVKPDIVEKSPKKIEPPKKKEKELQPPPKKETRPPPVDDFIRREAMKEDMTRQAQKDDISRVLAQENHASGQRASAEWSGRVAALVRAKVPVSIANAVPGNPTAEFEVSVLPGGVVGLVKLVKSSGYPAYDEAAARAVEATSPLPPTTGGLEMPRSFTLKARPKEQ